MMRNKSGAAVEVKGIEGRVHMTVDTPEGEVTMDMSKEAAGHLVSMLFDGILEAGVSQ